MLEGALRIHWGITGVIQLKEDDDQRVVVLVRKRNSMRSESHQNGGDLSVSLIFLHNNLNVKKFSNYLLPRVPSEYTGLHLSI